MLGRARDQVAGRRHQPDAEQHRRRAERTASATRPRGMPASASSRRITPPPPAPRRPAARRAARRDRPGSRARGSWVISSTVRSASRRSPRPRARRWRRRGSAVGSSRMTSGASRRNARASAIRWRWPAESARPASPTSVVVAVGSARTKRRRPPARPRRGRVVACARARPSRMLSATCRGTASGAAAPTRRCARQAAASQSARSTPPTATRPRRGLDEPQQQRGDGALAGAARGRRARPSRPARAPGRTPSSTGAGRPG